jgi:hypothetical protein
VEAWKHLLYSGVVWRLYVFWLFFAALVLAPSVVSAETFTRRDGFLLLWQSILRPAAATREESFADVPEGVRGSKEITYARSRGILDDAVAFRPDDGLTLGDALVWLLRTRNITDDPRDVSVDQLSGAFLRYPIAEIATGSGIHTPMTRDMLVAMMQNLDSMLRMEEHEVSLYAEDFHGDGTAFGEIFDMHALTAAHRSFPWNTLVRVTNIQNGKSVTVRINDRGPFVPGRDMDLSLAAFTAIASRSQGTLRATFERLGDASLVSGCGEEGSPRQQRLAKGVRLLPGVPHRFRLGATLTLQSNKPFLVERVVYPDGVLRKVLDWVHPEERFSLKPSVEGEYTFVFRSIQGRRRSMTMHVTSCAME